MSILRALTTKDAEITWQWRNLPEIKYFFAGHPFPVNFEKEAKWMDSILLSNSPHSYFGIEQEGVLCGIIALRDIDMINRKAEYSIFVAKGKGLGRKATEEILRFGFKDLGLNRIWLKVMEENKTAINLYKKCGFIQEGKALESVFKEGRFVNEISMAILSANFKEKE